MEVCGYAIPLLLAAAAGCLLAALVEPLITIASIKKGITMANYSIQTTPNGA